MIVPRTGGRGERRHRLLSDVWPTLRTTSRYTWYVSCCFLLDGGAQPGSDAPVALRRLRMAHVAKVIELVASSEQGFDDAVRQGLAEAARTIRGITGIEVVNW